MDQVSSRSGVGSDDVTDESASLVDVRCSSEEEVKKHCQRNFTAFCDHFFGLWTRHINHVLVLFNLIITWENVWLPPLWVRVNTAGFTSHRYHTCCGFCNKKTQRLYVSVSETLISHISCIRAPTLRDIVLWHLRPRCRPTNTGLMNLGSCSKSCRSQSYS